jgi:hypothetical protein
MYSSIHPPGGAAAAFIGLRPPCGTFYYIVVDESGRNYRTTPKKSILVGVRGMNNTILSFMRALDHPSEWIVDVVNAG